MPIETDSQQSSTKQTLIWVAAMIAGVGVIAYFAV